MILYNVQIPNREGKPKVTCILLAHKNLKDLILNVMLRPNSMFDLSYLTQLCLYGTLSEGRGGN